MDFFLMNRIILILSLERYILVCGCGCDSVCLCMCLCLSLCMFVSVCACLCATAYTPVLVRIQSKSIRTALRASENNVSFVATIMCM